MYDLLGDNDMTSALAVCSKLCGLVLITACPFHTCVHKKIPDVAGVEAEEAAASGGSEEQQGRASGRPAGPQSGQMAGTPYESVLLALLEGLR